MKHASCENPLTPPSYNAIACVLLCGELHVRFQTKTQILPQSPIPTHVQPWKLLSEYAGRPADFMKIMISLVEKGARSVAEFSKVTAQMPQSTLTIDE